MFMLIPAEFKMYSAFFATPEPSSPSEMRFSAKSAMLSMSESARTTI